jgi:hypothetical protein
VFVEVIALNEDHVLSEVSTIVRPDNRRVFCLDYLSSSFSSDQLRVNKSVPPFLPRRHRNRDAAQGAIDPKATVAPGSASDKPQVGSELLQLVATNSVDQTPLVIRRLIRSAFLGIASAGRSAPLDENQREQARPVASFDFDPFDQSRMALINARLTQFGFCLVMETYTTNVETDRYCNQPLAVAPKSNFALWYEDYENAPISASASGVLYRPRAIYQMSVYTRNTNVSPKWFLRKVVPLELENISPVLSVDLQRATLTHQKIALSFDDGDLTSACVEKGSELKELATIPLEFAQQLVSLPSQMIKFEIDNMGQETKLLKARQNLIQSQEQLSGLLDDASRTTENPAVSAPGQPQALAPWKVTADGYTAAKDPTFAEFESWARGPCKSIRRGDLALGGGK